MYHVLANVYLERLHSYGELKLYSFWSLVYIQLHLVLYVTCMCGFGSVLLWWQCNTLCTSGFVDDVMFSHNWAYKVWSLLYSIAFFFYSTYIRRPFRVPPLDFCQNLWGRKIRMLTPKAAIRHWLQNVIIIRIYGPIIPTCDEEADRDWHQAITRRDKNQVHL